MQGVSGMYGLTIFDIPFDVENEFDVSLKDLEIKIHSIIQKEMKVPKLIVIGTSMPLFPHNIKEIRRIADKYEILVLYDAAHSSGIIQGGLYQNPMPLDDGAHVMVSSTYKSFGGPNGGFICTNDKEIYDKICNSIYPGLTANFNMARYPSMCVALMDLLDFGKEYATQCVSNAQTLALELNNSGFQMFSRKSKNGNPYTQSHILALRSLQRPGLEDSLLLEKSNIIVCDIEMPDRGTGLRIGTQEITKRGLKEVDMKQIANFMSRILLKNEDPSKVKREVIEFRKQFKQIQFINKF
jgi:glycine hydroxymethyltransferase